MTLLSLGALILQNITPWLHNFVAVFSLSQQSLQYIFLFRLFGHVLGHANWEHYMNNFLLILLLGPMLEEKYGSRELLL